MPSYVTNADADTYFTNRLYADNWDTATEVTKTKALAMATKKIDRLPLVGKKLDEEQENAFPRCVLKYRKVPMSVAGRPYWDCDETVPQEVKDACCEEALALIERGNSTRLKLQQEGVQSFNIGISETFKPGAGRGLLSQEAKELLVFWKATGVSFK